MQEYIAQTLDRNLGENVGSKLLRMRDSDIIVCGDFNAVLNKDMDCYKLTTTPEIPKVLHKLIDELDLIDIW